MDTNIVALFQELLEQQFPIKCTSDQLRLRRAGDYASRLSVHVNQLNFAIREATGRSTSAHIKARIIDEARTLLKNTDWRIIDIARCLGFEYPNHFNTFFRKHTGVTPLSARREITQSADS
ncbi:MAG: AraC family transcriptional regulator [Bacteroidetes bacterium]|nr:AraC family transcriptional regulator [Bacteroidota bacterium]